MYHISLYEDGRFCSHIGGEIRLLCDTVDQLHKVASGLKAEALEDYEGYKFDRAGTTCALLITDEWGQPIKEVKEETEECGS